MLKKLYLVVVMLLAPVAVLRQQDAGAAQGSAAGGFTEPNAAGDRPRAYARRSPTTATTRDKLFSPSVSQVFHNMAVELAGREDANAADAEQAIVLLNAAMALENKSEHIVPDLVKIASRRSDQNRNRMVYDQLVKYIDKYADLAVAEGAAAHLLEQLNSREPRELLLATLLRDTGEINPRFGSQVATLYGLLMVERADDVNAADLFGYAFNADKYNQLAFEKLSQLAPAAPAPNVYLDYLRHRIREHPFDAGAAGAFAEYSLRIGLYDVAAAAYEYCGELFKYLNSTENLPAAIYLPWSISNYNSPRNQHKCIQIAEELDKEGRFDLIAEAIAAKAAARTGDQEKASQLFKAAGQKGLEAASEAGDKAAAYMQLAWFYCFANPEPTAALDWANKAYAVEPNSVAAAGILAYALAENQQAEPAKALIDKYEQTQPALVASGLVQIAEGQKDSAIDTLKSAIDSDPGSLVAEKAKEILALQGAAYIPLYDAALVTAALKGTIGDTLVPKFARPEEIISVQLSLRGNKFSYDSDFGGVASVTNRWSEPIVVSDDSLFSGNIRVDAEVTGDLTAKIPNLVTLRTKPSQPVEPSNSLLIPLELYTGELRRLLIAHPQASLEIQFTVYLDPTSSIDGGVACGIPGIAPAAVTVERPRVEITREFLQNRLNSLSWGRQGQKMKTAQLFVGLLMEQQAFAGREPGYKLMRAEWMPQLLEPALAHNLTGDDWVVKVHTMAAMTDLPGDYELTSAAAESLSDNNWPARLMALYTLAKRQGAAFAKVLDHSAEYDSSEYVRNMAVALGGRSQKPRQDTGQRGAPDANQPPYQVR